VAGDGADARPAWCRVATWLWLLIPHLVSTVAFLAGIALVFHFDSNRSATGRTLGTIGGTAAAWALLATIAALILTALGRTPRPRLRIVLAHLASLILALGLGGFWLGMHIA